MAYQYSADEFKIQAKAPVMGNNVSDRTFGLPTGLYAATVGLYLAFLAVMAIGFQTREMIIPMAIFVIYIAMAFGVPALWTKLKPEHGSSPLDWATFVDRGIETESGQMKARDAAVQVLILPVLILFWGGCTVAIAAMVG